VKVSRMMLGSWMDGCVVGPGSNLGRNWGTDKPNPAAEIAGSDRRGKDIMIPWGCGSGSGSGRMSGGAIGSGSVEEGVEVQ
jgi:hypothetical protein